MLGRFAFFAAGLTICSCVVLLPYLGRAEPDSSTAIGERFRERCAALVETRTETTIDGRDGWFFLRSELRHLSVGEFWGDRAALVSSASKPEHADPLPAITDYHRRLEQLDIRLLVVPVPAKAVVYPDKLFDGTDPSPPTHRVDEAHLRFLGLLEEAGVNVIDLVPAFQEARRQAQHPYCRTDSHWSGIGCSIAATRIVDHITSAKWLPLTGSSAFSSQERHIEIAGDLLGGLTSPSRVREKLLLRFVTDASGHQIPSDRTSPVVLLGDSHCLVFHTGRQDSDDSMLHASGAGLADQLALLLGRAVDVLGTRGSGARAARVNFYRRAKDPGYLAGKKLVIWCFSARELTEANGWGVVPVVRGSS